MRSGQIEMEFGTQAALDRAGPEWIDRARYAIASLCRDGVPFVADDVRRLAGDPPNPNALGAIIRTVANEGSIRHHAYRPSARPDRHGAIVKVWIAAA